MTAFLYLQLKHEVLSHFSAFGNVGICKETKTSCGITKFTFPESAAKVLGIDSHIIAGRSIDVAAANERMMHHVDTALLDLSDDTTTFLDLSDDCILEVLTMKCLELSHLC